MVVDIGRRGRPISFPTVYAPFENGAVIARNTNDPKVELALEVMIVTIKTKPNGRARGVVTHPSPECRAQSRPTFSHWHLVPAADKAVDGRHVIAVVGRRGIDGRDALTTTDWRAKLAAYCSSRMRRVPSPFPPGRHCLCGLLQH
jgi:hypothetical protein